MAQASFDTIRNAERAQGGGKYRLVAQRMINGHKCRCFAHVFMVGTVAYWNVNYIIDGRAPSAYNGQIQAMYELAQAKVDNLCAKGQETVLWSY